MSEIIKRMEKTVFFFNRNMLMISLVMFLRFRKMLMTKGGVEYHLFVVTGSKKVRLATSKFCGDAIQWWDQLVTNRKRTGEAQVASWFELKHFMKKNFVLVTTA